MAPKKSKTTRVVLSVSDFEIQKRAPVTEKSLLKSPLDSIQANPTQCVPEFLTLDTTPTCIDTSDSHNPALLIPLETDVNTPVIGAVPITNTPRAQSVHSHTNNDSTVESRDRCISSTPLVSTVHVVNVTVPAPGNVTCESPYPSGKSVLMLAPFRRHSVYCWHN